MAITGTLNETISLATDAVSSTLSVPGSLKGVSIQFTWTGLNNVSLTSFNAGTMAPNGASYANIQSSNDGTNWSDLFGAYGYATLNVTPESQEWLILLTMCSVRYLRLNYVANGNSAGSGVITSWGIT